MMNGCTPPTATSAAQAECQIVGQPWTDSADVNTTAVNACGGTEYPLCYGPIGFRTAYNITSQSMTNGSGMTVAVVDFYDYPTAKADQLKYRVKFNLYPYMPAELPVHL